MTDTEAQTAPDVAGLIELAQAYVDRRYTAHADPRQAALGLAYVTAERQDLAREFAFFTASTLSRPAPAVSVRVTEDMVERAAIAMGESQFLCPTDIEPRWSLAREVLAAALGEAPAQPAPDAGMEVVGYMHRVIDPRGRDFMWDLRESAEPTRDPVPEGSTITVEPLVPLTSANARISAVEAERDAALEKASHWMNEARRTLQAGQSALDHADAAEQRLADAMKAIEPFSDFADALNEAVPDDIVLGIYADGPKRFGPSGGVCVSHLRAARTFLKGDGK